METQRLKQIIRKHAMKKIWIPAGIYDNLPILSMIIGFSACVVDNSVSIVLGLGLVLYAIVIQGMRV